MTAAAQPAAAMPCTGCTGLGWRQIIHHNGMPDAEACPACRNPARLPCPWKLP